MADYLESGQYEALKENGDYSEEAAELLRKYLDSETVTYDVLLGEAIKEEAKQFATCRNGSGKDCLMGNDKGKGKLHSKGCQASCSFYVVECSEFPRLGKE